MKHLKSWSGPAWLVLGGLVAVWSVGSHANLNQGPSESVKSARAELAEQMAAERQLIKSVGGGVETQANAAASVDELLTAIGLDPADAINPMLDADVQQVGVFAGMGPNVTPTQGGNFAVFSSGVAGAATPNAQGPATSTEPGSDMGRGCPGDPAGYDCAIFTFSFIVPTGIYSILFDFNFLSAEYPEFVGTIYNDTFEVMMTSPSYNGNIVFDANGNLVSVNSAFFNMSESQLTGTGFGTDSPGDAGATGLLTTQAPVSPGETVTLEFKIKDEGDHIYDSAVVLDNFQYSTEQVDEPNTTGQVQVLWTSPKSGPIEGGSQVTIHGMNFNNVTEVRFGDEAAQFAPIDTETVVAISPPAAQIGPVDVVVTAGVGSNLSTDTYEGGFVYYDDSPDAGLEITTVDPAKGPTAGGVFVNLYGSGLQADSIVTFDGLEVMTSYFVHGGHLVVEPPPHNESRVEVRVTNVNGDSAALADGYLYLEDPTAGGGSKGCNCSMTAPAPGSKNLAALFGLVAIAFGVIVIRRRKRIPVKWIGAASAIMAVALLSGCNDTSLAEVNTPPQANVGENTEALIGVPNQLDGTNSTDPDGDAIVGYEWVVVSGPEGHNATFDDPTAGVTGFIPDVAGLYKVGLYVTDERGARSYDIGYGGRDDDEVMDVIALPFHNFTATLEWDTAPSDLDLHFIRPGGTYWNADDDCFYGSPDPEWGQTGIHSDDPQLQLDIDTGFGPEAISMASAGEEGTYLLLVHAFNMHGAGPTFPRVTVEMNGGLAGEYISSVPIDQTDMVWLVAEISYPSGELTMLNQHVTHQDLGGPIH